MLLLVGQMLKRCARHSVWKLVANTMLIIGVALVATDFVT